MLALIAAILFLIVVLGGSIAGLNLLALGLFFLALHHLVGMWPFGPFGWRDRS